MPYFNSDGLYIKTGNEEGQVARGGHYTTFGPLKCTEVKLDLTTDLFGLTVVGIMGARQGQLGVLIPDESRIEAVELLAETALVSATGSLDIGIVRRDRVTAVDVDGLVVALTPAALPGSGGRLYLNQNSGAPVGALVGTTLVNGGYLSVRLNTAVFTAGKLVVRVYWYNPQTLG